MNVIRAFVAVTLAAAAVGAVAASGAPTSTATNSYWIVLSSDRDGQTRGYSVRPDGSRLTPLLPPRRVVAPLTMSGDGRTVAYVANPGSLFRAFVSHTNGVGLRLLEISDGSDDQRLSRDGRLVAFDNRGIWVVDTRGRGLRRLTSVDQDDLEGWSPDGHALLVLRSELLVQPLRGKAQVLVRGANVGTAAWSPDGRWIGYSTEGGLYAIQPDGTQRHRIATGYVSAYAWSPDGGMLAFVVGGLSNEITVVGLDGRVVSRLHLPGPKRQINHVTWSPDGRSLAFDVERDSFRTDVWVAGVDGRGVVRLTGVGRNTVVGWTPLAPVQPPAPTLLPTERVVDAHTVATRTPVRSMSADGKRVVFAPASTGADCVHADVWTPAAKKLDRFRRAAPCAQRLSDVFGDDFALAGSRAAWIDLALGGNCQSFDLVTATLARRRPRMLTGGSTPCGGLLDYYLHGDGNLLVYNDGSRIDTQGYELDPQHAKLVRVGAGGKPTIMRSGQHACCVDSVSWGRIAINEGGTVAVLDQRGGLVRVFPFAGAKVSAAQLDRGRLVVSRSSTLESYDVASGTRRVQRPLPHGYTLADVDGGVAVLHSSKDDSFMLLRLADGRSFTFAPGNDSAGGYRLADLEPPGLYYSYPTVAGQGRVVFMPRVEVVRRLDARS